MAFLGTENESCLVGVSRVKILTLTTDSSPRSHLLIDNRGGKLVAMPGAIQSGICKARNTWPC